MHDTESPAARTRCAAPASSRRVSAQHVAAIDDAQIDGADALRLGKG